MAVETLDDTAFKTQIENGETIIVKYFADWCGSCRLISSKFKRLSEDERFTGIKFVEVDAEKNPAARKWAGVKNLPFFATVKKGEIQYADCVGKEEKLVEILTQLNA
ncbi:MAG: thioredoxin family protein [Bacteroidia bacterium]